MHWWWYCLADDSTMWGFTHSCRTLLLVVEGKQVHSRRQKYLLRTCNYILCTVGDRRFTSNLYLLLLQRNQGGNCCDEDDSNVHFWKSSNILLTGPFLRVRLRLVFILVLWCPLYVHDRMGLTKSRTGIYDWDDVGLVSKSYCHILYTRFLLAVRLFHRMHLIHHSCGRCDMVLPEWLRQKSRHRWYRLPLALPLSPWYDCARFNDHRDLLDHSSNFWILSQEDHYCLTFSVRQSNSLSYIIPACMPRAVYQVYHEKRLHTMRSHKRELLYERMERILSDNKECRTLRLGNFCGCDHGLFRSNRCWCLDCFWCLPLHLAD